MDIHNTDNNPPRHAIESDDEDEFNPQNQPDSVPELTVKLIGDVPAQRSLVVATADPGAFWARGTDLGEQTGAIAANGVQVGLVFNPAWTNATVIVSEALSRLPVWAMHPYAQAIIDALKPTSVALLDEYAVPSYISSSASALDAPIRFLSISAFDSNNEAQPFAPPNLVNTTSAAFLSLLSISNTPGTLILLPTPNILKPAPRTIEPSNFTHLTQDVTEWSAAVMDQAQQLLFRAIGEPTYKHWELKGGPPTSPKSTAASRRSEVGEGGMYL
ncbi:hypothetical protein P691DRAFT_713297 [Macrolepiota fuliginosa MF-IS2]|uniref:Proteasome assembly chaperone 1 n=1 Tax=Macrolepiota fuliginosa MF-IS2 TaxID=1400762 RepID=A0A9P5X581_9AGAR|nr:hypothetical protein P691DRAFT_713297 [Macrolepiota fuliginosa MF-IS2]